MSKQRKRQVIIDIEALKERGKKLEAMINLGKNLRDKEKREVIRFNDFLHVASADPSLVFRDIFQYFHDMVTQAVGEGVDEYEETEDTVGFRYYDFSELFVKGADDPFFADRLFANRLMNLVKNFRKGIQNNHIYLFVGPPGSGKSTFLNNLLTKLEAYNRTPEGAIFKTAWRLDVKKLGGYTQIIKQLPMLQDIDLSVNNDSTNIMGAHVDFLDIVCPSNDHPILQIPKDVRADFLTELIPDRKFMKRLFNSKEYRWVLKDTPCSICSAIYNCLLDTLGDPLEVFNMLTARKSSFDRQFGKGISVFNPGDDLFTKPIADFTLQNLINSLLKSDEVRYVYSHLANTNNGVYALMDIKENNVQRLMQLHGIISDGIHKVELVEERIKSLFVGLVNPEDKKHYENVKSFQDRITHINIHYVLDYETEVSIYTNKLGTQIESKFLPRVLENFGKIIIASRMSDNSLAIRRWIKDADKYSKYLDDNLLLLKMELYKGIIPKWLSEDDIRRFTRQVRKDLIAEATEEGLKGFSGRQSLSIFNDFYTKFANEEKLITMDTLVTYFSENEKLNANISDGFIKSLEDLYDYNVLQEVKHAVYYFSEKQVSREIQNYLHAVNFEPDATEKCDYTGDILEITEDFFKNFEAFLLGTQTTEEERIDFRREVQYEYIAQTLSVEIGVEEKEITQTSQYTALFEKYTRNLKENALAPFAENENFRRAILAYGTAAFDNFDGPLKRSVSRMIANLVKEYGYDESGAVQICIYVLDKKLNRMY